MRDHGRRVGRRAATESTHRCPSSCDTAIQTAAFFVQEAFQPWRVAAGWSPQSAFASRAVD